MRIAITGHSKGIGKSIFDTLQQSHDCKGFSRSNGYDITDILDIIEKTLIYIDIIDETFDTEKQNHMLSVVTQQLMFKGHTKIQLYNMVCEMCFIAW